MHDNAVQVYYASHAAYEGFFIAHHTRELKPDSRGPVAVPSYCICICRHRTIRNGPPLESLGETVLRT